MNALLEVRDLRVSFGTEDGVVDAVRGLSYSLAAREVLGVVGESGSGKSVGSLAVMGLLPRSARVSGSVLLEGQEVLNASAARRRSLRGGAMSMVFQDPMTSLNPVHTIGAQLAETVRSHEEIGRKAALERAAEALAMVGMPRPKERLRAYPHEFSGGMRQRVMIAMAIINRPDVIIADEPTTALDVTVQAQILETVMSVKDDVGAAVLLISHDLGVVSGIADRVLVMYAGRAVELGRTADVFTGPRMPYTAGLLGSMPTLARRTGPLRAIPGAPPSLLGLPPGCPFGPRCPLLQADCRVTEPDLLATDRPGQLAACLHHEELAGLGDPTAIFTAGTTGGA